MVDFPKAETIDNSAFGDTSSLKSVYFPSATTILDTAFMFSGVTYAKFPKATYIGGGVFANTSLSTLILGDDDTTTVCQNDNAAIPTSCNIYVPDALVDSYKVATNWSQHASKIKPISELEE
jgi:hypothetical protein